MTKTAISSLAIKVFEKSVDDYHIHDDINRAASNPYEKKDFEHLLYEKNWIDTVQWHLEDIIRDPEIDPVEALKIKRIIDASNQKRTDLVEYIDGYFLEKYKSVKTISSATINTETIAWAIDRLSREFVLIERWSSIASKHHMAPESRWPCLRMLRLAQQYQCLLFRPDG